MAIERKHRNHTMYDDMAFPDYEFREFPMAVPLVNGEPCLDPKVLKDPYDRSGRKPVPYPVVIVRDRGELEDLRAESATLIPQDRAGAVSHVETEDDVRERLYLRASQLGVKVDKRWSVERIEKAIEDAETVV